MRPLPGSLAHARDGSVLGRAAGHRRSRAGPGLPAGQTCRWPLLADVDASVARPRRSATVANHGSVQNGSAVFLDFNKMAENEFEL